MPLPNSYHSDFLPHHQNTVSSYAIESAQLIDTRTVLAGNFVEKIALLHLMEYRSLRVDTLLLKRSQ